MKKILVIFLFLFLTSCKNSNIGNLESDLNSILSHFNDIQKYRINNKTLYYSYYLPSDMEEFDGTENSAVISYSNSRIVMNLNISSIINDKFYPEYVNYDEGFFNYNTIFYENDGTFLKDKVSSSRYNIKIYKQEDKYYIYFITNELIFYGSSDMYDLVNLVKHIMIISRSVEVDASSVINNYSAKDVIDFEKKQVNLFDYIVPSDGYLSDLLDSSGGIIENGDRSIKEEDTQEEEIIDDDDDGMADIE